ncbi:phosphonate ABC transporter, permease protein PhnE [Halobacillus salinarum]|uniref:Phosphonate ABC transporter, permease protein PhnE n=1 Tax=Halobacillus salinarum TaxID=2932257 RepID=A0ABY4EIW4_9BACI|nr:phosphonate ABC transporter, permease protein PhnE [Halobacillus salinarum]UOQ43457.1 phosphonate ABC transporter, permease protein PhnE [Halobacillus salinarum]
MNATKLFFPNYEKTPQAPGVMSRRKMWMNLSIVMTIIILYFISSIETNASLLRFDRSFFDNVLRMLNQMWPPDMAYAPSVWPKLAETIHMAVISTLLATIVSIPLSLVAAQNVMTNKWIYNLSKTFLNVLRTIPELILAVLFVGLFGIGVFSGILALFIFSLGILAKLMAETVEAIDTAQMEAIQATGANSWQVIWYAIVPQVLPQFASFSLYVFEINVRASVVLGFVGAGGIGLLIQQQINFLNYPAAMAVVLIVFLVVLMIDFISNRLRESLL